MEKILVVEDDPDLQKLLSICLDQEGLPYSMTSYGMSAVEQVKRRSPSLIILDVMLPDMDGMEVCQQIRYHTQAPILFLSSKTADQDKIYGLSIGADDYIEKPFSTHVLMARIRAHLRRNRLLATQESKSRCYEFDHFYLDLDAREIHRQGKKVELTTKEFDILSFLTRHPNQVFTTEQLLDQIWGIDSYSEKRTVIVHISNLRKKLEEDPLHPKYIVTVRGVGYKFASPT